MAACCFGSVVRTRSVKTARWRFFQSIRDVTCTCILCQLRCSAPVQGSKQRSSLSGFASASSSTTLSRLVPATASRSSSRAFARAWARLIVLASLLGRGVRERKSLQIAISSFRTLVGAVFRLGMQLLINRFATEGRGRLSPLCSQASAMPSTTPRARSSCSPTQGKHAPLGRWKVLEG
jgi:hypothetical protein